MELRDVLQARRSYRASFGARKVTHDEMRYILNAAYTAPSGCNLQTARMVAVLDPHTLTALGEIVGHSRVKTATAALVMTTKPLAIEGRDPSRNKEDFGAAAQNVLLAVTDLGLATTWIQGQIENEKADKIAALLEIPEDYSVVGYFPIGEPTREVKAPNKLAFEERCFIDRFGQAFE